MRSRLVVLSACLLAFAVPAAKASAAPIVGISENQPTMFSDPLFTSLGAKHARIVVGWDVVEGYGGKVALAPLIDGRSTSSVIQRILDAYK